MTRPTPRDELLTPTELAEWLRVPLATVYQWRYKGEGPAGMKVGRHVRYRRSTVEDWLDDAERASPARD